MTLSYVDMIGVPYKLHGVLPHGLDCSTVCEEVLRRLDLSSPPTSSFRYPNSSGELGEFEKYMHKASDELELVGTEARHATRPGDILLVSSADCEQSRGMYVLVDQDLFLTCLHRSGVTPVSRQAILRLKTPVMGVYRCAPSE